jgi:outer membrane protein TolC
MQFHVGRRRSTLAIPWLKPLALAALVMAVGQTGLFAQEIPDTLRLADVVTAAREANPMLRAARLRADAATQRIPQAGAWTDPQLSFALMNRPLSNFGSDERMTMNQIQLTQVVPWPGKLGFAKEREQRLADAERLDAAETELALLARVKSVYYQLAYMDRALEIMEDTRDLLRDFLRVSSAMYAVGTALQQDVLQAQVAVAAMTGDITVMEQNRVAMAARLNALLGRDATAPLGLLELQRPGRPLPLADSLMAFAETRPALEAAQARVAAAEAGYRAARRQLYPDFMIGVGYAQRPQFDDMATIMIGVSIPLFAGSRQVPMRREMQAMQAMEDAKERDLYNETFAELTELRANAERSRSLSRLYTTAVLPQARAAVESALSAYRVGSVDYMTLVESEMTVNRYQIETVHLAAQYHQAVSEIEALIGVALGGAR